jgi:phenylacetic acid degradation protein paaN
LYANLITGNAVVVKPHPNAIYAIALVIEEIQKLLKENGLDVNTVMLAVDTSDTLITQALSEHEDTKMIDFTGGSTFGNYIESIPNKITFTEKAGVNSVIFDSFENWEKVIENLAFSVSLYSGQMCTSPQNFFIPMSGVRIGSKLYPYEEMVQMLVDGIYNFSQNPKYRTIFGALKCNKTLSRVKMAEKMGAIVLLHSEILANSEFPNAKLVSPTILEAPSDRVDIYEQELFGPILLVIPTENTEHSIQLAKFLAIEHGAISCAAYTTDAEVMQLIEDEMAEACTPVSFNFTGNFWVNQNAGFSDFHVTGGNPSGNASITNPEFIRKRYSVVGMRVFKETT